DFKALPSGFNALQRNSVLQQVQIRGEKRCAWSNLFRQSRKSVYKSRRTKNAAAPLIQHFKQSSVGPQVPQVLQLALHLLASAGNRFRQHPLNALQISQRGLIYRRIDAPLKPPVAD